MPRLVDYSSMKCGREANSCWRLLHSGFGMLAASNTFKCCRGAKQGIWVNCWGRRWPFYNPRRNYCTKQEGKWSASCSASRFLDYRKYWNICVEFLSLKSCQIYGISPNSQWILARWILGGLVKVNSRNLQRLPGRIGSPMDRVRWPPATPSPVQKCRLPHPHCEAHANPVVKDGSVQIWQNHILESE